jgi:macrolide transport system ATP-binding/permease protein
VLQVIRQLDATMPLPTPFSMLEVLSGNLWTARLGAMLLAVFGLLAVTLTTVGIYGVMAYSVTRRTQEIGIRMALGARRANVVWMILRDVCVLVVIGLAISVPTALASSKFIESFLFELTPTDPRALGGAVALLMSAALLAGYLPARRASRIDPLTALRHE